MADRLLSVDSETKLPPPAVLSALSDAINAESPVESVAGKTGDVTLSVDDLSDVTVTAPANGQVLRYNGTVWTNQAGGGGGGDVASVNGATGVVVLDADDIDDTSTTKKFVSAAEKTKLAGVATGATANASDASLLNRNNHTGSQTASTISDFAAAADARVAAGITAAVGVSVQARDADLDAIAALSPSNDDVLQRKGGAWVSRTVAQVKADLALAKGDVGLGSVDNTSDAGKPVSTATQAALNGKANNNVAVAAGTGLTGGGDLTTSRTLAVAFGTAAGTAAEGNDSRITGAAANSAVVHNTGAETVAGVKTFSASPVVPDGSFTIAKTTGLQAAIDAAAATATSELPTHAAASDPHASASYAIMVGGGRRIYVQSTAPTSPADGDIWIDTSA